MDLKLDTTGDLALTAELDDLVLVDGADAIAQDVSTRLKAFQGEWFLDTRVGMPYFQKILGQKPRLSVLQSIFRDAVLSTPGVNSINDLVLDYVGETRVLSISFRCDTVEGPLEYKEEFII